MICLFRNWYTARVAPMLCFAIALFFFAPTRATAALTFVNGDFENCSASSGGSTTAACPSVAAGDGGFALGDTPSGLGDFLQGWSMFNENNLHCVVTNPANNNFLCGEGWPAGGSSNLKMYALAPTSPTGGHYVLADADVVNHYNATISQTASGFIIGQTYKLSFYQAAGQQATNVGSATDWWSVNVGGTMGAGGVTGGTNYGNVSTNSIFWRDQSSLATKDTPSWQQVTYTFTANAASELIAFTSSSNASGVPPYLFLDGVSLTQTTPEPGTVILLTFGFIVAFGIGRRKKILGRR
jgi:hypothetical protein